jgi:hypothetical protein
MREQTLDIFSEASRSLSAYIPPEMQMAIEERRFTLSDGDVILLALERVFRQGLSRPLYKVYRLFLVMCMPHLFCF